MSLGGIRQVWRVGGKHQAIVDENRMKWSSREQQQLIGIFLLAAIVLWAYYAAVFKPLLKSVMHGGEDATMAQKHLDIVKQSLTQQPQLRQEHDRLTQELQTMRTALPSEHELPSVLERLANLASQTGVKVSSILPQRTQQSVDKEKSSDLYKEIPIQLDAVSGFHQLGQFLSRVEAGSQPIRVKSLRISENTKDVRRPIVRLVLLGFFSTDEKSGIAR